MMRRTNRPAAILVLGLALALMASTAVQAQGGAGVIEGQIVNGTAGGPAPGAGLAVTLRVVKDDVETGQRTTASDSLGRFRFDGLETEASLSYYAEVSYLDVVYGAGEPLQFGSGQSTLTTDLTVYETTEDGSAVSLDSVHIIADSFGQVLRIREILLVGNRGDRTYVGKAGAQGVGRRTTVSIPLPATVVGFSLDEAMGSDRFVETGSGLLDTKPVPPGAGTSTVMMSYHLVVAGSAVPLEREYSLPVGAFSVLAAQPGLDLRSVQLGAGGSFEMGGRQYLEYGAEGLAANTPVTLELLPVAEGAAADMPTATTARTAAAAPAAGSQGVIRSLGLGLAVLAPVLAGVYTSLTRRGGTVRDPVKWLTGEPRARQALAELAECQEKLETGIIDEAEYERAREGHHAFLRTLWK